MCVETKKTSVGTADQPVMLFEASYCGKSVKIVCEAAMYSAIRQIEEVIVSNGIDVTIDLEVVEDADSASERLRETVVVKDLLLISSLGVISVVSDSVDVSERPDVVTASE